MPPHCDSMDGPVVKAAAAALDRGDVDLILPYVPKEGEDEVRQAFGKVTDARGLGAEAKEVADLYFFETVVRIHRAGEGAAFTGLKPAGLGHGPVVPLAEMAIESGSPEEWLELMSSAVVTELRERFDRVMHLKTRAGESVHAARAYVGAMLGLQVFSHKLYHSLKADPHAHAAEAGGHHH